MRAGTVTGLYEEIGGQSARVKMELAAVIRRLTLCNPVVKRT